MPLSIISCRLTLVLEALITFLFLTPERGQLNRMFPLVVSLQGCKHQFRAAIGIVAHDPNTLTCVFDLIAVVQVMWQKSLITPWIVALLSLFARRQSTQMFPLTMSRRYLLRGAALATIWIPAWRSTAAVPLILACPFPRPIIARGLRKALPRVTAPRPTQ